MKTILTGGVLPFGLALLCASAVSAAARTFQLLSESSSARTVSLSAEAASASSSIAWTRTSFVAS